MSGNNTAIQPTVVIAQTDLSVVKTDSADAVALGENLTYTVTVTNLGPSDATGMMAIDTLPGGVSFISSATRKGSVLQSGVTVTANLGNRPNGQSAAINILVTANTAAGTTVINSVQVSGKQSDPIAGNISAAQPTLVDAPLSPFSKRRFLTSST